MSGEPARGVEVGRAWVRHLRDGGTTPWAEYAARPAAAAEDPSGGPVDDPVDDPPVEDGRPLPGAAQLEVLRRLNERHGSPLPTGLCDRVLDSSGPGRGQPDRTLIGIGDGSRFGPPPADPAEIDATELTRIAVGALAETALVVPLPPPPPPEPPRVPWRRDHRLLGDPVLADQARAALEAAGHRRGRRPPVVVVLGRDLGTLLADVWRWRVAHGTCPTWPGWLAGWERRDQLPPRADLAALAARWAGRVGAERVHVVLDADPATTTVRLLGHRGGRGSPYAGEPVGGAALEVLRRTNAVLRVMVPADRHRAVLEHVLRPAVGRTVEGPPAVPEPQRRWVRERAERLREELSAGGYAVHGDPGALLPAFGGGTGAPTSDAVLDAALHALLTLKEALG